MNKGRRRTKTMWANRRSTKRMETCRNTDFYIFVPSDRREGGKTPSAANFTQVLINSNSRRVDATGNSRLTHTVRPQLHNCICLRRRPYARGLAHFVNKGLPKGSASTSRSATTRCHPRSLRTRRATPDPGPRRRSRSMSSTRRRRPSCTHSKTVKGA